MKAQDRFPFDSTILGLNGIFNTIGSDSFFINSECILATDKIITIGKEYIIFESPVEAGIKMLDVTLVDCYYRKGIITLIVQNLKSQGVLTLHKRIERPECDCTWVLIDINFCIDKINWKAILDYCSCDVNIMEKHRFGESNTKINEDLSEFDL